MKKLNVGAFGFVRNEARVKSISFILLIGLIAPWQTFASEQLFRETKNNFAPHPFLQPDLSTGNFLYSLPIAIPAGRNGVQPSISLNYNSSGGKQDSIVGYGWSLNIPYIERLNKNGADKLYNQDLAHSYFYSSLSGELLQSVNSSPINGSVLGVAISTPRLAMLRDISFQKFLDIATSAPDTTSPASELTESTATPETLLDMISSVVAPAPASDISSTIEPILDISSAEPLPIDSGTSGTKVETLVRPNGELNNSSASGAELTDERSLNSKLFFKGYKSDGTPDFRTHFYPFPVHYLNTKTGQLSEIDTRFESTQQDFRMTHAPYRASLDKSGVGHLVTLEKGGLLFAVDAKSEAAKQSRSNAMISESDKTGRTVTYPDLLGKGIDLRITAQNDRIIKEAVIKDYAAVASASGDYFEIPFQVSLNSKATIATGENVLSVDNPIVSSSSVTITSQGESVHILPPYALAVGGVATSSEKVEASIPIDIAYTFSANGFTMTKRIPLAFLKSAVYPVVTDATFDFSVSTGGGDGYELGAWCNGGWAECRSSGVANEQSGAGTAAWARSGTDGVGNTRVIISRLFLPFDTTSLSTTSVVTAATLYLRAPNIDSGSTTMALIKTTQTSVTSLSTSDYANLTLNNPAEGAARKASSDWAGGGYSAWPLNATGTSWIVPGGYTRLGIREALHDVDNVPTADWTYYGAYFNMSESGAGSAPYLEVSAIYSSGINLLTEGVTNPLNVATPTPRFSAVFVSATSTAIAAQYEIQVSTSSTSWANPIWDSGQVSLSSSTPNGMRSPDILYGGSALALNQSKYYWRIKFWDQSGAPTYWSTTADYFIMGGTINYGAKVEGGGFMKYTHVTGSNDLWYSYDKRGVKYTFGSASSSRVYNPAAVSSPLAFRWMLDSVVDTNGNSMAYTYATDSNQIYPSKIVYTTNGTSTGIYEVGFIYEPRTDISTSSYSGFTVTTKLRLKEILIYANAKLIHRYQLGYGAGDDGYRSLLTSFQESAWNSSTGTTTPPAARFTYSTSGNSWATSTSWTLPAEYSVDSSGVDTGSRVFDATGDSLPDLIFGSSTYKNTGAGWASGGTAPAIGFASVDNGTRVADINGDGYVDQVQSENLPDSGSAVQKVYFGSPTGFTATTSMAQYAPPLYFIDNHTSNTTDHGVRLADVDGDGLADLVRSEYGITPAVYINSGSQWVYDTTWSAAYPTTTYIVYNNQDAGVRFVDVNGDGLVDIVASRSGGVSPANLSAVYLNTGTGWVLAPTWNINFGVFNDIASNNGDSGKRFVDVNSDGLPDVGPYNGYMYMNTGSGWATSSIAFPTDVVNTSASPYTDLGVTIDDINGDGLSDVIRNGGATKAVWLKTGKKADMLTHIDQPKGAGVNIAYGRSSGLSPDGTQANPSLQIGFDTVANIITDPGFGGKIATSSYIYKGGLYYYATPNDRQFASFASSSATNDLGFTARNYYHQGNTTDSANGEFGDSVSKIGRVYRSDLLDGTTTSANLFSRTINKWARADYGDGRNFVKLVRTLMQVFDGDTTHRDTAATTTYDDMTGNISKVDSWGEVSGNTDGSFTDIGTDAASSTYTYAASSTNAAISLPSREFVNDQSGVTVKDAKWTYDGLSLGLVGKGNQTKEERLKSGTSYASTTMSYDQYGNLRTFTDARGNTSTTTYDAYNLFPATTTNTLGQSQSFLYDYAVQKVATATDANGRVFATLYDGFGRPVLEKQPDFNSPTTLVSKASYSYSDTTTTPSYVIRKGYLNAATTSDAYEYFDGLGRSIQKKSEAEPTNGWVTSDTIYNNIGSVGSQSLPYFTASSSYGVATTTSYLFANFSYDAAGRVLTVADAIGTTTTTYSDGMVRATDALGNKKEYWKDAWGNLAQVVEYLSATSSATTTYSWTRLGKLSKLTDALGNIRNFTYDTLGRLLASEDLHAAADTSFGTSTWAYDDAGNVTAFLNPRGQTINYGYDKLSRVTSENYTGATGTEVTYAYDSGTNGVGRLSQVAFQNNATTTYSYNPLGSVINEAKKIANVWGTTTSSYLRSGSVDTLIYPDASQVAYIYDDAGLLERVKSKEPSIATTSVINSISYSPTGQTAVVSFANGMISTSSYDQTKKYRLTTKQTKGSTTLGFIQNLAYNYDAVGNITQLSDIASTSARKTVNYGYDSLYRLLSASTTVVATSTSAYLQSFTYDVLGNMLTGPSGAYSYGQSGYANPDAATAIVTTTIQGSSISTATPAYVQGGINASTSAVTLASPVTSGNLIIVGLTTCCQGSIPTNPISDNKGNSYTYITQAQTGQDYGALFYARNVTGGSNFTVSTSFGGTISAQEYSGIATSSPLDKYATGFGTSTALATSATTTTLANELAFGLGFSIHDLDSWTAGSGYTLRQTEINNATVERHATEDKVLTSAGSNTASFSVPTNAAWLAVLATFKPLVTVSGNGTSTTYATSTLTYDNSGNLVTNGLITNTWDYHNYLTQTVPSTVYVPATIAFNSSSSPATQWGTGTTSTTTWTHTTSGTNRLLVLSSDIEQYNQGTGTVMTASYGGQTLTKGSSVRGGGMATELWYLMNPPSGANTMQVVVTGKTYTLKLESLSFTGVDQTAAFDTQSTTSGYSGNPTLSLTTGSTNALILALLNRYTTQDATSSKTKLWKNADGATFAAGSYQFGTSTGIYTDTYTGAASSQDWSMLMSSFKPAMVATTSTSSVTYLYDQSGSRVYMKDNSSSGTTTSYWGSTYSQTPTGYKKWKNVYAGGVLVATLEKVGTGTTIPYYVATDHQGGTSVVTNSSGVATETLDYYPYGGVRIDSKAGGVNQGKKYISSESDTATGLNYMNARYQNPTQGQFISQDPILLGAPASGFLADPQSLNYYAYAEGDPINRSDPSGLYVVSSGLVQWGDTPNSIGNDLNAAFGQKYGVYFTGQQLADFNGLKSGQNPAEGSYFSYSIDLANKRNVGGGSYIGGETNVAAAGSAGASTPAYYANAINGYQSRESAVQLANGLGSNERSYLNYAACGYLGCETSFNVAGGIVALGGLIPSGGASIEFAGLGTTARYAAKNLLEQLTLEEIRANPALGKVVMEGMKDSRWAGWNKLQYVKNTSAGKIVVHYVGDFVNGALRAVDDFKIIQ